MKGKMLFAICGGTVLSCSVMAEEIKLPPPAFYGNLNFGGLKIESQDADMQSFQLELGLKGVVNITEQKVLYEVAVDFSDAVNNSDNSGSDEVHVKQAKMIVPTRYGTLILAPRTSSGQWMDIYHPVFGVYDYNIARANNAPGGVADGIFAQNDRASSVLAYATPNVLGHWKLVGSVLTLKHDNDEDFDAKAVRAVYHDGKLHFALGSTLTEAKMLPTSEDYYRHVASVSYSWDALTLGAIYEHNDRHPSGDFDAYGANATYRLPAGYSVSVGYKEKNHDKDELDNSAVVARVAKDLNQYLTVWAETGQYDELDDNNNYAAGLKFRF
ncbi:hypothetical protein C7H85_15420 [Zobellella endophytica]|uniref:Porin domain-containing protein n=1 Tax=Zobellella endophytica TaxID=2116700 RepID=A0A2P7R1N6_9GAMM|nr:porin [Zobellella endophytica]PSJ44132.1 hypothetical protein C7H85_15420 [Zobellella endophytica]